MNQMFETCFKFQVLKCFKTNDTEKGQRSDDKAFYMTLREARFTSTDEVDGSHPRIHSNNHITRFSPEYFNYLVSANKSKLSVHTN